MNCVGVWGIASHLAAAEARVGVERPAVEGEGEEEVVARVGAGGVTQHQLRVVHL